MARERRVRSLCVLAGDEREEKNEKNTNHTAQSNIITRLLWKTHTHNRGETSFCRKVCHAGAVRASWPYTGIGRVCASNAAGKTMGLTLQRAQGLKRDQANAQDFRECVLCKISYFLSAMMCVRWYISPKKNLEPVCYFNALIERNAHTARSGRCEKTSFICSKCNGETRSTYGDV